MIPAVPQAYLLLQSSYNELSWISWLSQQCLCKSDRITGHVSGAPGLPPWKWCYVHRWHVPCMDCELHLSHTCRIRCRLVTSM
ncbi:hypothetical protein GDO78_016746 [Eleutherodactylus coqui]|uniref:Uncharacterized protein n=1 Tax=Eleutherodactylus coqui TaxID=57060 RepID=A0A8J6BJN0_ELECQ|nr:hypothetical protein GDO78_016746 [Eleutherodactylus coqui]